MAGRAALAEAVLAAAQGRHVEAQTQFERALGIFRTLSLPWDEAEAFEIWARACARFYRGRGRRSFIGEKLASASAIYERIGAGQPWLERLEVEEKQLAGRNSNELAPGLPDRITQREADVLRLIAAGKSNREVADELVLSVRTVERHITNIYTKIGAHGKADATAYALRHSLI
jgi:DNA-binding CsgD family transcriptional regulator